MTLFKVVKNVGVILLLTFFYSQSTGQESALDITDIKSTIAAYADAREVSNPDELRKLFTEDADQLVSSGEWRNGIEEMVAGMLRSSKNNPGDRSLLVESVRFIREDVAVANARYEIKREDGSERKMWSTFVLLKDDTWKISAIRNMLPAK
ncbi:MAG: SgcJ/EcaC family oxidoreductase [Saprospiraceae bacterium]|nr:SgcJ/EcaC family oxidoreductase [Saprospiraceae bacterium]